MRKRLKKKKIKKRIPVAPPLIVFKDKSKYTRKKKHKKKIDPSSGLFSGILFPHGSPYMSGFSLILNPDHPSLPFCRKAPGTPET